MVQILPRFDPGGEIGRSLGSGIGQGLSVQADRQRLLSGLDALQDLDKPIEYVDDSGQTQTRQPNFADKLKALTKAFAGYPGGSNIIETLAPIMLKEAESESSIRGTRGRTKPETAEDITGYVREDETEDTISPRTRIERLVNQANDYVTGKREVSPDLTSELPRFGREMPAYQVPSVDDLVEQYETFKGTGGPEKAWQNIQRQIQLGVQDFESQMQGFNRDLKQFQLARGLEEEQRQFVDDKAKAHLFRKGIIGDMKEPIDQYYGDIAYRQFQDEKRRNPKRSDQALWSQARQKLDQMIEHEAAVEKNARPLLPVVPSAKGALQKTQDWVDGYYKLAGNTPETRNKAKTLLMKQGWSRDRASRFAQPRSTQLKSAFDKIPKLDQERPGPQGQVPVGVVNRNKQKMEQIQAMVPELAKKIQDQDSLLTFRNDLVRKKGLNKIQADEIIESIKEAKGGFIPVQESEISVLQEHPGRDLWEMFYSSIFEE